MFERFTERSRQVVVIAQEEARRFKHNYIGTEHILIGLLRTDGLAGVVLDDLGLELEHLRQRIREIVGEGDVAIMGQIPFTPRSKKVLELALREALSLGHNYIGTEHILLGLARENEGVAARYLIEQQIDQEMICNAIIRKLQKGPRQSAEAVNLDASIGRALAQIRIQLVRIEKALALRAEMQQLLLDDPPAEEQQP